MMAKIHLKLFVNPGIDYDPLILDKLFQDFKKTVIKDSKGHPEEYRYVEWIDAYLDNNVKPVSGSRSFIRTNSNMWDEGFITIPGYDEVLTEPNYRMVSEGDVNG